MKTNKDKFKQNQEDNAKMIRLLEREAAKNGVKAVKHYGDKTK